MSRAGSATRIDTRALPSPWLAFAVRRTGRLVLSLFLLVTASFAMLQLIPGDPARASLGLTAPAELVAARRETLGLNQPLLTQYVHFIGGLLQGDLGRSFKSNLQVSSVIGDRLPETLKLATLAFVVVMLIAIPVGLAMAVLNDGGRRRNAELAFTSVAGGLAAIPEFLLAVGLVYLFAVTFPVLPVAGMSGPGSYILPVVALAVGPAAALARVVRVEALGVLGQDYIRTARAKRLPARLIYLRHTLPNMLTAALTIGGLMLTGLIAGTILVENVFAWPGLGTTMVQSIQEKDYPLVQGVILVYGAAVLVVNLIVDVVLALLDPRSMIREG